MNCYTYMVQCSDGTLYTGWTNDLKKRLEKHNVRGVPGVELCRQTLYDG